MIYKFDRILYLIKYIKTTPFQTYPLCRETLQPFEECLERCNGTELRRQYGSLLGLDYICNEKYDGNRINVMLVLYCKKVYIFYS